MKLLALFFFFICVSFSSNAQIGVGVVSSGLHNNKTFTPGIGLRAQYSQWNKIEVSGSISAFFPEEPANTNIRAYSLDVNGHYLHEFNYNFKIYGLLGLNISLATTKLIGASNDIKSTDTSSGINLGVGARYGLESFDLFAELKYLISSEKNSSAFGWNIGALKFF